MEDTKNNKESVKDEQSTKLLTENSEKQVVQWVDNDIKLSTLAAGSSGVCFPAVFPQKNTNLNTPPSNWLRSNSTLQKYLHEYIWSKQDHNRFSSFDMGHRSPDLVGEVDVISDAENIKKLLKMPYSNSHVSLMVHRVGKSILLEDFDIQKHLLRQQEEDWKWLSKFYRETVARDLENKMKCIPKKNRSRNYLQMQNLYSKLLYYSVAGMDEANHEDVQLDPDLPVPEINVARLSSETLSRPGSSDVGSTRLEPCDIAGARVGATGIGDARLDTNGIAGARLDTNDIAGARLDTNDITGARLDTNDITGARLDDNDIDEASLGTNDIGDASLGTSDVGDARLGATGIGDARLGTSDVGATADVGSHNIESTLPAPDPLPQPSENECHREVLWTFEDIRMLIGTDLPVFKAGSHPCVSLKLRDMDKPINVLTGLDYWLDNLMCNVPELAMCFHISGIVQNYELIKTSEIPNLKGSSFSTKVVTDIASNILSFLKANVTKEGHTYWLYKGVDDDVIKLYDLTTLCAEDMHTMGDNPFSVPLGMLLYRVARNMREHLGRKRCGTIRKLLNTCLLLLNEQLHSQVCTSANYLLADLYVPDDVTKDNWSSMSNEEAEAESDDTDQGDSSGNDSDVPPSSMMSVDVKALCIPERNHYKHLSLIKYPGFVGSVDERCKESLFCIQTGLECLDLSVTHLITNKPASEEIQEDTPKQCNPAQAIPMKYEPINSPTKRKQEPLANQNMVSDPSTNPKPADIPSSNQKFSSEMMQAIGDILPADSWHYLSKVLLLRKAAMAYYVKALIQTEEKKYGAVLKHVKLALKCFCALRNLSHQKADDNSELLSLILGS